jgi:putative Mg2+ transporter-C (MgtC) family protein
VDPEWIIKLVLAVLIGGSIGMERELRSKSAGFRTLMLICVGATLFTIISQIIGKPGSPDRIASNVVVGIGFIGAGVVFKNNNRVNGITTAAAMWLTAALGVGIGCGLYQVCIFGGLLVVSILFLLSFLDDVLDSTSQLREYKITYPYEEHKLHKYENLMKQYGLKIKGRSQTKTGNIITGIWTVTGSRTKHHAFIDHVLGESTVTEFGF